MKNDVYQIVTDRIIAQLEKGIIPWRKPWVGYQRNGQTIRISAMAVSHATGKPYSMLNQLLLGRAGEYLTWNQIKAENGSVKKGVQASIVCFWKQLPVEMKDENGNAVLDDDGKPVKKMIPFLRYYNVFHIDDCDGIKHKWDDVTKPQDIVIPADHCELIPEAGELLNAYVSRENIKLVADKVSDEAYYSPFYDMINIPCFKQFQTASEYYSTAFHEATHSTGHHSRLGRFEKNYNVRFGSGTYSKEELVAEIGAASICHSLGIETASSFENSVAYIQSWLKQLKDDPKMVVHAAARAEKAVAFIYGDKATASDSGEQE